MGKILVTGATGTVGSAVVKSLARIKADFVAGVRDHAKAKEKLGASSPLVTFDFADLATYAAATQGVDRVFLIGPPLDYTLDKLLIPFIDYLKSKNIVRVVYLSAFGVEKISHELSFHKVVEEKLRADGFHLTVLRPTFFAQNFKNYEWDNITKYKITYTPSGNGKTAFVDIADVGDVTAKVLTESGHEGKDYILTGPESISYHDAAQLLTEVRKEPIAYPAPTPEQFTETLKQAGAPDFIAPYMIQVYSMIANHHVDYVSPVIPQLLGRAATPLKTVLLKEMA
ncbi:MAG: SDR family oxidoreductase [Bacteroidetes bacterium]|nr:SDR family oxidoreductase [Bacteroidota bacterium]